jgi:hypothetical protein
MRSKPTRNPPPIFSRASRSKVPINKGHLARAKLMLGCAIDSLHEVDSTPHRDSSENFTPHVHTKLPQKFYSSGQIPGLALLDALCGVYDFTPIYPDQASPKFHSEEEIPDLAFSGHTLFSQDLTPHTQRSFPKILFEEQISGWAILDTLCLVPEVPTIPRFAT